MRTRLSVVVGAVMCLALWLALFSPVSLGSTQSALVLGGVGQCCTGTAASVDCPGDEKCEAEYDPACINGGTKNVCEEFTSCSSSGCSQVSALSCSAT
jgi:hypothetical protein